MIQKSGIIYYYPWHHKVQPVTPKKIRSSWSAAIGLALFAISLGGIAAPFIPRIFMDTKYELTQKTSIAKTIFNPLVTPDGQTITPASTDFGLIIPKIGVNAIVIPSVNPLKEQEYSEALKKGIAHSSLSYYPNQNGTIYLFSHSTNYDWFVKDLNAAFYLLKNLEEGDIATIMYKNIPYTYKITEKRIVSPTAIAYLVPEAGVKRLILETCWPPGSTKERLLIFADLVQDPVNIL